MYFDGATNLSGSRIEAVLIAPKGQHYLISAKLVFLCTNNIAEYEACILGLQLALSMKIRRLQVYGDFMLIILQTTGEWQTRDAKLIPYHKYLERMMEEFEEITFDYLPRAQNHFADALATLSSLLQAEDGMDIKPLRINILEQSAHCMVVQAEFDNEVWFYDIKTFLQAREFPKRSQSGDRKFIKNIANKFFLSGQVLYKKSFDSILLRCINSKEAEQIMREIHEG